MDDQEAEIAHLQGLRARYVQNRRWLEEQQAVYGTAVTPLHILNQLQDVRTRINDIDQQLFRLGGPTQLPTALELLERINSLEDQLSDLRSKAFPVQQYPTGFSWGEQWYYKTDGKVHINQRQYDYAEIASVPEDMTAYNYDEFVRNRVVQSPDARIVALLLGTYYTPSFHPRMYEDRSQWKNNRLEVFKFNIHEPVFATPPDYHVYTNPVFSTDSRYLAFAYASDWSLGTQSYEADGEKHEYEVAVWNEHVVLVGTNTWQARTLITKPETGYGEWSSPETFTNLTFINNNSTIFGISVSERGVVGAWNIAVDGSSAVQISNPFFEENNTNE